MQTIFHSAESRGYAHHGWLTTHHSFSFANYYDPEKMGFGALRVINDDSIAAGQGFGRHPHNNMEIITIPLSGALAHEDSMGNAAVIETGEVQVMSAGTGVEHSEFNASRTEVVTLLQIWILTKSQGIKPRYDQKKFASENFRNTFSCVVGSDEAIGEGLTIHQDAFLSLGTFEAGKTAAYALKNKEHGVYVFVIEGQVTVAGRVLEARDALGVWETDTVTIETPTLARVLLIEVPMRS